ncbi:hypothetical protein M8J77_009639 [Diaphorina citri]|nr:hypothetical protein M8J77_009639 [Diaphorina citri]
MTIFSKEVFRRSQIPSASCSTILHPHTSSCTEAVLIMFTDSTLGAFKYLLPLYVISNILKYKEWDYPYMKFQVQSYLRTTLMAGYMGTSYLHANCILRNLLGEFKYYNTGFVPAMFGGLGIFIEHPKRRPIITNAFTNLGFQAVLASLYHRKILPKSLFLEALLFMTSNAYLMYQLQQNPSQLWVFKPPPIEKDSQKCSHKGGCSTDVIKAYVKYFGFGFLLEIIRALITNFTKVVASPRHLRQILFDRKLLRLGNFLGCYVAVYKLVCCCLRQVFGRNDPRYSLIAGFIAGQAYLLLPKHSFLAPTVNNAIQICYGKSQLRAKYLHKVPMAEILHLLSNAFMFHLKVVDKHSCPSMFQNMMRFCSGKASDEIAERFYHFYAQH